VPGWNCEWRQRFARGAKIATLGSLIFLSACAGGGYRFMDHATLVLRPSHKQALIAYTFGGGEAPPHDDVAAASRSVAASLAGAMEVNSNPLPSIDTVDFKGGRFYIHTPRPK
jgi:hypothetical protein